MPEIRFGSQWTASVVDAFDEGERTWGLAQAVRYNNLIIFAVQQLARAAPRGSNRQQAWNRDVYWYHLSAPNQFLAAWERIGAPAHAIIYRWLPAEDAVELVWLLKDGMMPWNVPR